MSKEQGEISEGNLLVTPCDGETLIIPKKKTVHPDFMKALHKFQYGEGEESDPAQYLLRPRPLPNGQIVLSQKLWLWPGIGHQGSRSCRGGGSGEGTVAPLAEAA